MAKWQASKAAARCAEETAMTTLASPIGTTPMRCTMAIAAIGQRSPRGVADLAHLGQRHLRIRLVLEPRHGAPVVVVARRADEGHRRAGRGIGHCGGDGGGVDGMLDDLEHRNLLTQTRRARGVAGLVRALHRRGPHARRRRWGAATRAPATRKSAYAAKRFRFIRRSPAGSAPPRRRPPARGRARRTRG